MTSIIADRRFRRQWFVAALLVAALFVARDRAAGVSSRAPVPISRFVPANATPEQVRAGLQRASEYSARNRVAVEFGPGTLEVSGPVHLRGGTHFVGRGGVVRRSPRSGSYLFQIDAGPVTVEGLRVDLNGGGEFTAAFAVRSGGVKGLRFERVHFFDSREPDPSRDFGDRWGILIAPVAGPVTPVENLTVRGCRAENGIQLTAGYGSRGVRGALIAGNTVVDPEENGIALVMAGGPGGLEAIRIEDNVVEEPRGIGIYIGVDKDHATGTFVRDVRIERNVIRGFHRTRRGGFGILFRAAELGNQGIVVRGNQIFGQGDRNAIGIRLQAKAQVNPNLARGGLRFFDRPVIENNRMQSVSPGIDLWHTRGGVVRGNRGPEPRLVHLRHGSEGVLVVGNGGGG